MSPLLPIHLVLNSNVERVAALAQFADCLASSPETESRFVDYFGWHECPSNWTRGRGAFQSITFDELGLFWNVADRFIPYESTHLYYHDAGLDVQRIFLINVAQINRREYREALQKAVMRHTILGFPPKILANPDLVALLGKDGIRCDAFVICNIRLAVLIKLYAAHEPSLLRTENLDVCAQLSNLFQQCWKMAWLPDKLRQEWGELSKCLLREVERDVALITEATRFLKFKTPH